MQRISFASSKIRSWFPCSKAMCGIAGIFHYQGRGRVAEEILAAMRDAMIHRGPDGGLTWTSPDGRVGLAHRRLSIIDLSATAAQPLCNEDGTVWVTYNGEIWNHRELRAELECCGHTFKTDHSDTEVIVHGYEQWGVDGLLQRLDGDFGFGSFLFEPEYLGEVARKASRGGGFCGGHESPLLLKQ